MNNTNMNNTNTTNEPRPDRILQLTLGFWGTKTLMSAVELGVFTALGAGPLDEQTLSQKVGLHPRAARDFLDALVGLKMLEREGNLYRNTPDTAQFLDANKPGYIGGFVQMCSGRLYAAWGNLTEALRTGKSPNDTADGNDAFKVLYSSPERLREFLAAMTGISMGSARAIARKFRWSDYRTFVDVGCAQGAVPVQLALAHPHLSGAGFDLPVVKPVFEEYVAANKVQDRVRFIAGDFFKEPLPSAQVIVMGHVLHDWGLPEKRQLIAKAYDALPKGGALIVYESLIDDDRRQPSGLLMSLNMLVETPDGFDYTGADCQRWLREAGFRETWQEHLCGPESMVVGIK